MRLGRSDGMPYALRVRLYRGSVLEADTDPELEPGEPGAEVVTDLAASQRALVELCEAMHGPDVRLLGFSDPAMHAYGCMLRDRAGKSSRFSYEQGYSVLIDTPQLRSATRWRAQVDIVVSP